MNLDLSPSTNISDILREASETDDLPKKSLKLDLHVHALEEELKKIEAFKRELPHCMHLLKDAIERLKEEGRRGEFTVFRDGFGRVKASNDYVEKRNWMSSVQLCTPVSRNQDSVFHLRSRLVGGEGSGSGNPFGRNLRRERGAFWPFKKPSMKEKQGTAPVDGSVPEADVAPNDLAKNGDFGFGGEKPQQPHEHEQQKKQRRCWSPELHKIFVDALHQLGGAQTAATPKQIRELMKVEGLTNDEVKSHLQKYRIHVKRMADPVSSARPSQFAVSGSPQGPLPGGRAANGVSATSADDDKPESHGWKSKLQQPL